MNNMEPILSRWKLFEQRSRREKAEKEMSDRTRSSMGGDLTRGQDQELERLSKGMMEGDELELEDDELELEELEEKKKKRTQCIAGNPNHSPVDGRFQERGKKGSWSIGQDDPGKGPDGCRRGVFRTTGRGDEVRIVTKPCGRLQKKNPDRKAPNKCSVRETSHPDLRTSDELEPLEPYITLSKEGLRDTILEALQTFVEFLADDEEQNINEDPKRCPPGCGHTWASVLKSINAAVNASSGKLYQDKGGS